jgi:hypothetical protein
MQFVARKVPASASLQCLCIRSGCVAGLWCEACLRLQFSLFKSLLEFPDSMMMSTPTRCIAMRTRVACADHVCG